MMPTLGQSFGPDTNVGYRNGSSNVESNSLVCQYRYDRLLAYFFSLTKINLFVAFTPHTRTSMLDICTAKFVLLLSLGTYLFDLLAC